VIEGAKAGRLHCEAGTFGDVPSAAPRRPPRLESPP
jgi:hypothetical protein